MDSDSKDKIKGFGKVFIKNVVTALISFVSAVAGVLVGANF